MKRSRVDAILELTPDELMKMSRADMARNISKLASASNKRIKRLEESGVYSPSVEYVKRHGGKFSVAGKTKNQLLTEFLRLQEFMESKTSTISGVKKWKKTVKKATTKAVLEKYQTDKTGSKAITQAIENIFNDPKQEKKFWDIYSRLSNDYDVKNKYKDVWDDIANTMIANPTSNTDDIWEMITKGYDKAYAVNAPQDNGAELLL